MRCAMNKREAERSRLRKLRRAQETAPLHLRLPKEMRARLITEAAARGRTVTDEVIARCFGEGRP